MRFISLPPVLGIQFFFSTQDGKSAVEHGPGEDCGGERGPKPEADEVAPRPRPQSGGHQEDQVPPTRLRSASFYPRTGLHVFR